MRSFCGRYAEEEGTPAGEQRSREYNDNIRLATLRHAIRDMLKRPPGGFEDIVRNALVNCNVTYGINNRAIEKLCSKRLSPKRKRVLTMARGGPPINGEDTRIEYTFDPDERPGKIMPDGSIDFRERNVVTGVNEDQLLATVYPATEGIKGYTIFNEELNARDGQEYVYEAGENVRTEGNPPAKFFCCRHV